MKQSILKVVPLRGEEISCHAHKTGSLHLQKIPISSVIHFVTNDTGSILFPLVAHRKH